METYAQLGVPYYVIYDPEKNLSETMLRCYTLQGGSYLQQEEPWFPSIGLGLRLWQGEFEGREDTWLRWCGQEGNIIPTGEEHAYLERQRAEEEHQRAEEEREGRQQAEQQLEALKARMRELGLDPES